MQSAATYRATVQSCGEPVFDTWDMHAEWLMTWNVYHAGHCQGPARGAFPGQVGHRLLDGGKLACAHTVTDVSLAESEGASRHSLHVPELLQCVAASGPFNGFI